MANVIDNKVVFDGTVVHAVRLINESDGTEESAVVKVDKSGLTGPLSGLEPTSLSVEEIECDIQGFNYVTIEWDHDTNDKIVTLSDSGYFDFRDIGGLDDPVSTGGTGDIVITTDGAADGASYNITLRCRKRA